MIFIHPHYVKDCDHTVILLNINFIDPTILCINILYGRKYWHGIIFGGWRNEACVAKF